MEITPMRPLFKNIVFVCVCARFWLHSSARYKPYDMKRKEAIIHLSIFSPINLNRLKCRTRSCLPPRQLPEIRGRLNLFSRAQQYNYLKNETENGEMAAPNEIQCHPFQNGF